MSNLHDATNYFSTSLKDPVKLRLSIDSIKSEVDHPAVISKHFRDCFQKYAQRPALAYQTKTNSSENSALEWKYISYSQYDQNVHQTALMLLHLGVKTHSAVGILANNCPEWFYIELATLRIGGVVIGLYPSSSPEAVYHVLCTADVSVCIVDSSIQMNKLREIQSKLPKLHAVVQLNSDVKELLKDVSNFPKQRIDPPFRFYYWLDLFTNVYKPQLSAEVILRENNVAPNDCAMLIFTSGTMGMPKGVMLTHDAVTYDTKMVAKSLANKTRCGYETFISYLPLNHIVAQIFDVFLGLEVGACIYFPSNDVIRGGLQTALKTIRPTFFFGVPRIFEKLEEHLNYSMTQLTSWSIRYNLSLARKLMLNYYLQKNKDLKSFLMYWLATIGLRPLKISLGLENCKYLFIGGAPVSEELKRFFLEMDLPLTEVFGMSETSGPVTLNFDYSNLKVVGKPIGDMKIKINNPTEIGEGEICLYGRNIFMGYIKESAKTAETFTADGWLQTGDWGYLNKEGYLIISGRIKDLIITSGGENIPPTQIEDAVKQQLPCISNAVLIGDRRKYLTLLLTFKTKVDEKSGKVLDKFADETIDWLQSINIDLIRPSEIFPNLHSHLNKQMEDIILAAIWKGIEQANHLALSTAQRIQYFTVLPNDFTTISGELGDTLKIKRQFIITKYSGIIEAMYKPGFCNKFSTK